MWTTTFQHPFVSDPVGLQVYGNAKEKQKLPVVLYFHAGLFNHGHIKQAAAMATALSTQAVVVCVDYPLAPTIQFPHSVEIAFAALIWVVAHAREIGGDTRHLFIAGEQAGGNLAAAVTMLFRDRKLQFDQQVRLSGQMLINPMLDASQTTPSMRVVNDNSCRQAWADYIPFSSDRMHPYASPLQSCRLAGLAPILMITNESSPLRDETEAYAAKLLLAGVHTQIHRLGNNTAVSRTVESCRLMHYFILLQHSN